MSDPSVRLRIVLADSKALGPGKADLLAAIDTYGSISAAGRSMNMSYQRAWSLVEYLNALSRRPLVVVTRGGAKRGGATLSETGRKILAGYRTVERELTTHCRVQLAELAALAEQEDPDISE